MNPDLWLVVGLGHPYRGDDAAGLLVIRYLQKLSPQTSHFVAWTGAVERLLDLWNQTRWVILVDAMVTGAYRGTIHRFPADLQRIPFLRSPLSSHGLGVPEILHLAETLGTLPDTLIIFGIEGQRFKVGDSPSPEVVRAAKTAAQEIANELKKYGILLSQSTSSRHSSQ